MSLWLKTMKALPLFVFLRAPKPPLRRSRRKGNFGASQAPYTEPFLMPPHSRQKRRKFTWSDSKKNRCATRFSSLGHPSDGLARSTKQNSVQICALSDGCLETPVVSVEIRNSIVPGVVSEKVRYIRNVQQGDVTYIQFALCGQQCQSQGMLIIVRDEPTLDCI